VGQLWNVSFFFKHFCLSAKKTIKNSVVGFLLKNTIFFSALDKKHGLAHHFVVVWATPAANKVVDCAKANHREGADRKHVRRGADAAVLVRGQVRNRQRRRGQDPQDHKHVQALRPPATPHAIVSRHYKLRFFFCVFVLFLFAKRRVGKLFFKR
jgi:hypothetical protein